MSRSLEDRVVLVTGGSSGIGRATALAFAAQGARVVVASRRLDELERSVRLIEAAGGVATAIACDVTESAQVERLIAETVRVYGQLDCAFNNAGIEGDAFVPTERYAQDTWDRVIATNLTGVFLCLKHELPHIARRGGAIVNMASVAGLVGGRLGAAYYASKHGVVGLTKAAAMEYGSKGVRVNAIAPAVIPSPMTERAFFHAEALVDRLVALHPMGRMGTLDEVANAVV